VCGENFFFFKTHIQNYGLNYSQQLFNLDMQPVARFPVQFVKLCLGQTISIMFFNINSQSHTHM